MKTVILREIVNDASELAEFLNHCKECGADLSVTNVASFLKIEGEEIGVVYLVEEKLSDNSIVHNIQLHG